MRLLAGLLWTAAWAFAADDIPQWVRDAAAQAVPAYPGKVDVAVLLNEEQLSIENDGKRVMRERGALKCIARNGRCSVSAYRSYNTRSGRIRDFRGWLLPAGGKEIRYGKERIADSGDDTVEVRTRALDPGDDFRPGAVFAYEVIEEEKSVFTQTMFTFQGRAPVLASRYIAALPSGWETPWTAFNHHPLDPTATANTSPSDSP